MDMKIFMDTWKLDTVANNCKSEEKFMDKNEKALMDKWWKYFWANGGNISGQMVKIFMDTWMLCKWWKIRGGEREEPQEVATDGYYFCIKMHLDKFIS